MSPQNRVFRFASLIAVAYLALATGQASAGDSPWFIGAKLGQADGEAQLGTRHPKFIDGDSETIAVEVGYTVNRYLAIQAGFHDLGSHVGFGSPCLQTDEVCIERLATLGLCAEGFECVEVLVGVEADLSGFSLALVPSWPLGERVAVFGKVGVMAWDGDVAVAGGFGSIGAIPVTNRLAESFSGEELLAGVGVGYEVSDSLGLVLGHEELDLDVSATSVGMRWRF